MAAQGYQESGLNQSVKSEVGAVGVMQVMPSTGKELKVGDITKLEPNIHAGVKLHAVHDRPVLRQGADGRSEQSVVYVRLYATRDLPGCVSSGARPKSAG